MLKIAIPFRVQIGEQTVEGSIRLVDALAIERHFGKPIFSEETWPLDWLVFGAWNSLKRSGAYAEDYDAFTAALEGFTTEEAEDPKGSEQEASPESSPSSPTT